VAIPSSLGIWKHAEELAAALSMMGVPVRVRSRPDGDGPAHFHFGNSGRRLLPALTRRRHDLVTVHDVLPRRHWLRPLLGPAQAHVLARHRVVVHSNYASGLLRSFVPRVQPVVIPLSHRADLPTLGHAPDALRAEPGQKVAVVAGVLKQAKGIAELVDAAQRHPDVRLVLVGRIADRDTRERLSFLPANVAHIPFASDETFLASLAGADAVISLRRDSVGEASGPVVQAHLLGTPVVGIKAGSLPEYCGEGDGLLSPSSTADDVLTWIEDAPLTRVRPGDPRRFTIEDAAARYSELYRDLSWW
jgi:glycosyltransferase involved in cell wall biosynthesis